MAETLISFLLHFHCHLPEGEFVSEGLGSGYAARKKIYSTLSAGVHTEKEDRLKICFHRDGLSKYLAKINIEAYRFGLVYFKCM